MSILSWFRGDKAEVVDEPITETKKKGFFSTDTILDADANKLTRAQKLQLAIKQSIQKTNADFKAISLAGIAMDDAEGSSIKSAYSVNSSPIADAQIYWYGSQGFIGYQMAAILAQNWLIDKACYMPAKDAIRKGWEITVNDGTEIEPDVMQQLRDFDKARGINKQLLEFIHMGRVFGIRLSLFLVETDDPKEYYGNPFNIDAVKPDSYKGISQIDPYWITPELDLNAASNPMSPEFYIPTWWMINGLRIHRSHFAIFTTGQVADILKPSYLYGGIPIPQKIYERVYAAERTANEAPMLAMSKRLNIIKVDMDAALANQAMFEQKLQQFNQTRDNFGVYAIGTDETLEQIETSLTDLDQVIMTQYQIVSAGANVPSTKLLGTAPKGFNATGEFDEASYHEELESLQAHDLTPFLDKHYLLTAKSLGIDLSLTIAWLPLDSMTAKESAEVNKIEAETGAILVTSGAIMPDDERLRVIADKDSGYTGLQPYVDMPSEEELDPLTGLPIEPPIV